MVKESAHAFGDDALAHHDGVALAALIRSGDLEASDVLAASIARARAVEPRIHAIVAERFDPAQEAASAAGPKPHTETRGFDGVPTFIKDMTDVAGMATRFGTEALAKAPPAERNDPLAQQMFDMGMVCLGKSTMPEFGFTPSTEFPNSEPTRNPWNLRHSAGGSSGGAAALVAAGVVPIAHAADGGGSIRIPAASCGLVGLKPSRGRLLPSGNTKGQLVSIVVDGVVTRSVRDTALYYSEAEARFRNPKLAPIGNVDRPIARPLRIAAISETIGPDPIDAATRDAFDATVSLLESLGHKVEPHALPVTEQLAEDFSTYWSLLAFGAVRAGKLFVNPSFERDLATRFSWGLGDAFKKRWWKAPGAIYRLRKSASEYAALMTDFDLILSPTLAHRTPELGYLGMDLDYPTLFPRVERWACFTPYANATGAPAISLPLGRDEENNLPLGMMFGARHGDEALLLELALQLEQAQPWGTVG